MMIKDALAHYRNGTATEQERLLVEEELEKQRLLFELLEEPWEADLQDPAPLEELKKVRKDLRRRNIALVATSLALVAAILFGILGSIYYKFPNMVSNANDALSDQYPDPGTRTFCQYASDLELLLSAYSKLFHGGITSQHLISTDNRLGNYSLSFQRYDSARQEVSHMTAAMNQGVLTLPVEFWYTTVHASWFSGIDPHGNQLPEEEKARIHAQLSALPEYITVKAAVSFPEDRTVQELLTLENSWDGNILWAAVRNSAGPMQSQPLCGIDMYCSGQLSYDSINAQYPSFVPNVLSPTAEDLETHFKSLLQFLSDRKAEGTELTAFPEYKDTENDYQKVLDFVQENGISSYGCIVTATPKQLLALLDGQLITQAYLLDAWLSV